MTTATTPATTNSRHRRSPISSSPSTVAGRCRVTRRCVRHRSRCRSPRSTSLAFRSARSASNRMDNWRSPTRPRSVGTATARLLAMWVPPSSRHMCRTTTGRGRSSNSGSSIPERRSSSSSTTEPNATTRWSSARYEKDALPRDRIWRTTSPESLVLITCGGDFNPDLGRYRHNIVVYAVPVG